MLEFHALSIGDLYRSIHNNIPIFNENCKVITRINDYDYLVFLVDDRYYFMDTTDAKYYFMKSFQSLEETKKHIDDHRKASFIKIAYDNVIGYVNTRYLTIFN